MHSVLILTIVSKDVELRSHKARSTLKVTPNRYVLQRIPPHYNSNWREWVILAYIMYLCRSFLMNIFSGVGFGICQRLLSNFLGLEQPVDSLPQALATPGDTLPCQYTPCTSLTIIMACRTKKAGEGAREKLLKKLDEDIKYRSKTGAPEQRTRYNKFRETLRLDILPLELSHSSSVLDFCDMVQQRYVTLGVTFLLLTFA